VLLFGVRVLTTIESAEGTWANRREAARALRDSQKVLLASRAALDSALEHETSERAQREHLLFRAPSLNRIGELFVERVLAEAEEVSLTVESIVPRVPAGHIEVGQPVEITVVVAGVGALSEIGWWLSSLESGEPLVRVSSLLLGRVGGSDEQMMRVEATLVALALMTPAVERLEKDR